MKVILVDNGKYRVHPIDNLYAESEDRKIIHIAKQVPHSGNLKKNGYMSCNMPKYDKKGQKICYGSVWECYKGYISDGKVIDHMNDAKIMQSPINDTKTK